MMLFDDYSNWVEVDLSAIESNVRLITKEKEQKVMAVVKANAYGHGSLKVAKTALKAGAEWLAVARAEEAMELRESGIKQPVLVLGFVPLNWVKLLILSGVSMVAWDIKQIENIAAIAEDINVAAKIHIKVDTGMSRIGVQEADVVKLVRTLKDRSSLIFEGVL
ncbi:MAG TPA: alanine racemase, partial [Chloroflexi bacterium]|nr:alanine racemase [Chloroflexota bacterium]